jgi:Putative carbonic anhydrase
MASPPFLALEPFEKSHPRALAIYCSDGRFTNAVEELLRTLGHARLDTLTMPGGPALFNAWLAGMSHSVALAESSRFLIESHGIRQVILIAHEGCGFYRKQYAGASGEQVRGHQEDDLRRAASVVRNAHPSVEVLLYRAQVEEGRVKFVALSSSPA